MMQFLVVEERSPCRKPIAVFKSGPLDEEKLLSILKRLKVLERGTNSDSLRIKEYDYDCWSVCNEDESISYLIFPDPNARSFAGW